MISTDARLDRATTVVYLYTLEALRLRESAARTPTASYLVPRRPDIPNGQMWQLKRAAPEGGAAHR